MSNISSKKALPRLLLEQLRHPIKLRLALCLVILVGWYFLMYSPLSDRMAVTQTRIEKERKRIAAAREIDELRKSLIASKGWVPAKSDLHELIQYVMGRIRTSPLKLIDLKPEKEKSVGPFTAIPLRLTLEGTYSEIDDLLAWIKNDRRLLCVDSLSLAPTTTRIQEKGKGKGGLKLHLQLSLTGLIERSFNP